MKETHISYVKHFTDLEVWRPSHNLFLEIFADVERFPNTTEAGIIADQILRSCMSISANMSEGFNRSQKQFLNFLSIAKGSCNETDNWLYKHRDERFMSMQRSNQLVEETVSISKMLQVLMARIRRR